MKERRARVKKSDIRRAENSPEIDKPMRLNRYLALAGLCSRREADGWISKGKIQVNGETVTELGSKVQPGDEVFAGGKRVSPQPFEYILLNKPNDTITTTKDEKSRQTVMDLIEVDRKTQTDSRLYPVGRLDRDTVGVLLITNDGDLAHRLMHPSYVIPKLYLVKTKRSVTHRELEQLLSGVELDDGIARVDQVEYVALPDKKQVGISLHEGRNRQIRRMFEALGHEIATLERVQYAGLTAAGVRRGKWRRLDTFEITKLRRLVRLK